MVSGVDCRRRFFSFSAGVAVEEIATKAALGRRLQRRAVLNGVRLMETRQFSLQPTGSTVTPRFLDRSVSGR